MISGGDLFPNARNYLFLCVIGNEIRFADEIQPGGLDDIRSCGADVDQRPVVNAQAFWGTKRELAA